MPQYAGWVVYKALPAPVHRADGHYANAFILCRQVQCNQVGVEPVQVFDFHEYHGIVYPVLHIIGLQVKGKAAAMENGKVGCVQVFLKAEVAVKRARNFKVFCPDEWAYGFAVVLHFYMDWLL